jgi:hypothetical protein
MAYLLRKATGQTSEFDIPGEVSMNIVIMSIVITLQTSSTTGNRRLVAAVIPQGAAGSALPNGVGYILADTGVQSTVSSTFNAVGSVSPSGLNTVAQTQWTKLPIIGEGAILAIGFVQSQSGDTFDLIVECQTYPLGVRAEL